VYDVTVGVGDDKKLHMQAGQSGHAGTVWKGVAYKNSKVTKSQSQSNANANANAYKVFYSTISPLAAAAVSMEGMEGVAPVVEMVGVVGNASSMNNSTPIPIPIPISTELNELNEGTGVVVYNFRDTAPPHSSAHVGSDAKDVREGGKNEYTKKYFTIVLKHLEINKMDLLVNIPSSPTSTSVAGPLHWASFVDVYIDVSSGDPIL
jgi:hypothetical protein